MCFLAFLEFFNCVYFSEGYLSNFRITVHENGMPHLPLLDPNYDGQICATDVSISGSEAKTIVCSYTMVGQYIALQKMDNGYFYLCEIQVYEGSNCVLAQFIHIHK